MGTSQIQEEEHVSQRLMGAPRHQSSLLLLLKSHQDGA